MIADSIIQLPIAAPGDAMAHELELLTTSLRVVATSADLVFAV